MAVKEQKVIRLQHDCTECGHIHVVSISQSSVKQMRTALRTKGRRQQLAFDKIRYTVQVFDPATFAKAVEEGAAQEPIESKELRSSE